MFQFFLVTAVFVAVSGQSATYCEKSDGTVTIAQNISSTGTAATAASVKTDYFSGLVKISETADGTELEALSCAASITDSLHFFGGNLISAGIASIAADPSFSLGSVVFHQKTTAQSVAFKTASSGDPDKAAILISRQTGNLGIYLEKSSSGTHTISGSAQYILNKERFAASFSVLTELTQRTPNQNTVWFADALQKKRSLEIRPASVFSIENTWGALSLLYLSSISREFHVEEAVRLETRFDLPQLTILSGLYAESRGFVPSSGKETRHPLQVVFNPDMTFYTNRKQNIQCKGEFFILYQLTQPKEWYYRIYPDLEAKGDVWLAFRNTRFSIGGAYQDTSYSFSTSIANPVLFMGHLDAYSKFSINKSEKKGKLRVQCSITKAIIPGITFQATEKQAEKLLTYSVEPEITVKLTCRHLKGTMNVNGMWKMPEKTVIVRAAAAIELR